jgi:hypothetical protein
MLESFYVGNFVSGEGTTVQGHAPRENVEFLHSLDRYFTYSRTRFEETLLPKVRQLVRSKKYFCEALYCTHK